MFLCRRDDTPMTENGTSRMPSAVYLAAVSLHCASIFIS
jgi:hypothetical protein